MDKDAIYRKLQKREADTMFEQRCICNNMCHRCGADLIKVRKDTLECLNCRIAFTLK